MLTHRRRDAEGQSTTPPTKGDDVRYAEGTGKILESALRTLGFAQPCDAVRALFHLDDAEILLIADLHDDR